MVKRRIVIALGGNAILSADSSAEAQQQALANTAKHLVDFIKNGDDLIITHGNGPQVGNLLLQQKAADSPENPAMPLDTLVAMTEGSISYWLQTALINELNRQEIDKKVASLVTEIVVDPNDPAFTAPSKPIGPFLSKEEAAEQQEKTKDIFKEDAGRGWRKVVPSPKPLSIKEIATIKQLLEAGTIIITAGGGGIPVVEDQKTGNVSGIEAVVDKDFASSLLSDLIAADMFILLTGVTHVYVNFNTPKQKKLETVTSDELQAYIAEGQFAPGSMLPKVEAAIAFVESHPQAQAIITSLDNLTNILTGSGTVIVKGR
ncbi:carbamate kinase [Streptococcus pantholopis]|uniref:Carbamate kinase n=1 Tax=Streptococcus pantholopis TaxID=1811193 RepID=A0A172QAN7_9STRE|nr:carbamate kinase [Streptococcus pantholopis]AND80487.1 carbamate kinase [Streptococcus pantholopis]